MLLNSFPFFIVNGYLTLATLLHRWNIAVFIFPQEADISHEIIRKSQNKVILYNYP